MILLNLLLFFLRVFLTAGALLSGSWSMFVLGILSLLALVTTVYAANHGQADKTLTGFLGGVGYLAPMLLPPIALDGNTAWWFWTAVGFHALVKVNLWHRTTVTCPVWLDLQDRWLYAVIRHPMTLAEIGIVVVVVVAAGTMQAWLVGLAVVLIKIQVVQWEETFLLGQAEYAAYAQRVPYRLVPKIY